MKNTRHLHVVAAIKPSKTNARTTHTTKPFMLKNPFKNPRIDWLLVGIILLLSGGAVLFLMAMNVIKNS